MFTGVISRSDERRRTRMECTPSALICVRLCPRFVPLNSYSRGGVLGAAWVGRHGAIDSRIEMKSFMLITQPNICAPRGAGCRLRSPAAPAPAAIPLKTTCFVGHLRACHALATRHEIRRRNSAGSRAPPSARWRARARLRQFLSWARRRHQPPCVRRISRNPTWQPPLGMDYPTCSCLITLNAVGTQFGTTSEKSEQYRARNRPPRATDVRSCMHGRFVKARTYAVVAIENGYNLVLFSSRIATSDKVRHVIRRLTMAIIVEARKTSSER